MQTKIHDLRARCYLFIDEIQYVDYWQDIVKRFYDQNKRLKFVLTGSQSSKLRGKSKESLAGRLIEYHLQPFSFEEYCILIEKEPLEFPSVFDLKESEWLSALQDFQYKAGAKIEAQMPAYLSYGQFPEVAAETNIDISYRYIRESVLGKMLENDLPAHHGIERAQAFQAMAYHLLTNSSSLFEMANIGADLGISKVTVGKYLGYLRDSTLIGILHNVTRSAIKKGRSLKKAYAGATCFITVVNKYPPDFYDKVPEVFGKVVETYAWWKLSQRFEEVSFWRHRQEEVDFIVTDTGRARLPIEVKFGRRIRSEELRPLLSVMERQKTRRALVLTRNKIDTLTMDGRRIDLMPFYLL
jgi:predicted AAA+ superfamily ATPase